MPPISNYNYKLLDKPSYDRYQVKISNINNVDPYGMDSSLFFNDYKDWPNLSYCDIYNYLINKNSNYTFCSLKAYKSLEAYNYFISGFVSQIGRASFLHNCNSLFKAQVSHSQKMNESSLIPWMIVDSDGVVLCAHCTCMAGIGEVSNLYIYLYSMFNLD